MGLIDLRPDHQEDFENALRRRKRSPDEFVVSVAPEQIAPPWCACWPYCQHCEDHCGTQQDFPDLLNRKQRHVWTNR
jgi:hypothetical protein